MRNNLHIIKASGEREKFSKEKLYNSLKRAGVESKVAEEVCKKVIKQAYPGITSENVLKQVSRHLREKNPVSAIRYNLKRAIMELGPTGFPFERFIAEVLREYGFSTRVGRIIKGFCVNHEIDVVAKKENKHFMIECKYHNSRGRYSDIKVALYVYARFLDIEKSWKNIPGHQSFFHQAWLVTNTRCTSEAIRYARCVGLKIVSWRYPKNGSLEYLIEKKGLYPITVLPSLTKRAKERLAEKKLMLTKDLLKYSTTELAHIIDAGEGTAKKLQEEVRQLCSC